MIDLTSVVRLGLLLVRPGLVVMLAPGIGGSFTTPLFRIATTVLLALVLAPIVTVPAAASDVSLTLVIAREVAIGLSLGLAVRTFIAAAELAGHLAGYQIGFSYAATIDPATGVRNSVITSLYGLLALLTFLGINGHHHMLRALAASYARLPVGAGHVDASILVSVRELLGLVFEVGLRLAAPVVLVLLVVELAVGLVSRSAPSMNFMVIGYPIRLIVGLLVLAAGIATVPGVIGAVIDRTIVMGIDLATAFR